MCSYSYFPRVEGMLDDGINAFSMEYQPEEFYKNQPADIQECFDAYGVENYVELLGKNDAPGSWYPMYSYSDSIPTTSECGKVKNNLEAVKKRWLPQVIMQMILMLPGISIWRSTMPAIHRYILIIYSKR